MANMLLSNLINENRFSDENILNLCIYFPFGILLLFLRLGIGILVWLASAVLPEISSLRLFITNFTCFTLGAYVKHNGQRDEKTHLIVANYVSIFDSLALHVTASTISPSKWDLPPPLAWALGIRNLGSGSSNEQLRDAVKKKFADIPNVPMAIQPEGCPTSGKGILKFSEWPFMLYDKVQPAAIEVSRGLGKVTTASLSHWADDSIAWADLFWFLWSPYTVFTVHLLPVLERADQESTAEFAARVQKTIADFLKVEATEHTSGELRELVLAREAELALEGGSGRARAPGPGPAAARADLQRMAAQVKEVLPAVPLAVILKDLGKTRSVDVTLGNILEGAVPYTPEEAGASTGTLPRAEAPCGTLQPLRTAAASFPKTAHDRQLSYQERKAQLVQAARQRYIEKHGLTHLL